MQCFVCSEVLEGLHRQGSSGSGGAEIEQPHSSSQSDTGSRSTMTGARPGQTRTATPSATQDGQSGANASELACPCCAVPWRELGLEADAAFDHRTGEEEEEQQRAAHVEACLFAAQQESGDSGLDLNRDGVALTGKDEDGSSFALHGTAEEEDDSETKGRQVAAHGRSTKDEGGGDAAHETSVNSTPGLIHLLAHALNASHASPHGRTSEAYLATEHVEHVSTRLKDYGWGCGYKNAQMIYSAFRHVPQLDEVLRTATGPASTRSGGAGNGARAPPPDGGKKGVAVTPIPPIKWWQETIEAAWKQGFDPDGAAHFRNRLVNSRRWIGTTEIFTALSFTGIQTLIVDFPKSKGPSGTNLNLVSFIVDYFRTPNFLGTAPPAPSTSTSTSTSTPAAPAKKTAFDVLTSSGGTAIHRTEKQPLYLQHHGHSRTIVGIEIGKRSKVGDDDDEDGGGANSIGNAKGKGRTVKSKIKGLASKGKRGEGEGEEEEEVWLLLFDPGKPIPQDFKKAAASLAAARQAQQGDTGVTQEEDGSPPASKKPRPDQKPQSTSRRGSPTEARRNGFGSAPRVAEYPPPKFGEVLKLFRVNMRELKKKDDYQVLFVDPDAVPLSAEEKARKKRVTSIVIGGD
ncbi:hypothetical protein JCM8115_002408 [Rhodotorula mucilaginosa]